MVAHSTQYKIHTHRLTERIHSPRSSHPKYPEYSKEREDFSWIKDQKADGTYWWTEVAEKQKVD